MKLLDKIKNAIFEEEEEFDETISDTSSDSHDKKFKEKEKNLGETIELVKKIDIEKTLTKRESKSENNEFPIPKRELRRTTPIVFEEEDFEYEKPKAKLKPKVVEKPLNEEENKVLYGGYKEDKPREKFKPSPIISPVYGFVGVSPVLEQKRSSTPVESHVFTPEEPEKMSLDEVRMKAYGAVNDTEDVGLLYEMESDDTPAISKVTLGDAEEYFEDLGLEYNIDYKDESKEKELRKAVETRSNKNKKLSDTITKEIQEELEAIKDLEITKEQLKPRTAEEIKKVKKIDDINLKNAKIDDEIEEKNLYDLIDMMYDSK